MTIAENDHARETLLDELRAERYGVPVVMSPLTCRRCGQLGCEDTNGRLVHIASGVCPRFEAYTEEISA